MGPLSNVWKAIKNVENESSGEMTLPLEEVATNLNKSVQLLGQAFQSNITTITMHFLLSWKIKKVERKFEGEIGITSHKTSNAIWWKVSKLRNRYC